MLGGISAIKGFDYQKEELAVSGLPDTQLASAKLLVITVTRLLIAVIFPGNAGRDWVTTMISPAIVP